MSLAKLPLDWTWKQWNPSLMESPWEWHIRPKVHDPAVVEGDQHLEQVWVTAGCLLVEMHVTNWAKAQREDPMLNTVLDWLKAQKQTNLRMLLTEHASSEEGKLILKNWKKFCNSSGGHISVLNTQRWNWRSPALCGPKCTPCCHTEWVSLRCRSSRAWLYAILVERTLLVARNDQPGAEVHKVLCALPAAWSQFVQGAPAPNCVHHSNGSLAHRLY